VKQIGCGRAFACDGKELAVTQEKARNVYITYANYVNSLHTKMILPQNVDKL